MAKLTPDNVADYQPPRRHETTISIMEGPFDPGGQPQIVFNDTFILATYGWNVLDVGITPTAWHWGTAIEQATAADCLGVDMLIPAPGWSSSTGSSDVQDFDALTTAYAAAARTSHAQVAVGVSPFNHLHPVQTARFVANVDHIAAGRGAVLFSVDLFEAENGLFGMDIREEDRYAMANEYLTLMKHVWSMPLPFNFEGTYFRTNHCALVGPRPTHNPRPPILVAGSSDRDVDFAAKNCDILILAGTDLKVADLSARAAHARDLAATRYGRTLRVLARLHVDGVGDSGRLGVAHGVIEQAISIDGSPDESVELLQDLATDGALDGVVMSFTNHQRGLHRLEDELLPRARRAGLFGTEPRRY